MMNFLDLSSADVNKVYREEWATHLQTLEDSTTRYGNLFKVNIHVNVIEVCHVHIIYNTVRTEYAVLAENSNLCVQVHSLLSHHSTLC